MSQFMVIHKNQDIPAGFKTYSALLIPDSRWMNQKDKPFQLFNQYKEFGDAIGPDHLAFWPCGAMIYDYDPIDGESLDVFSIISGTVKSDEDISELIVDPNLKKFGKFDGKGNDIPIQASDLSSIEYDILRAKHFCACYSLNFNSGPYIAFFEEKPIMPIVYRWTYNDVPKGEEVSKESPTKPAFLLQFKDMDLDQALSTLNELEYEIMRGTFNLNRPRWSQFKFNLENLCEKIADRIGRAAKVIKDVKDIAKPL
jgi:hypothetical protein